MSLSASSASPGTYPKVTVDAKGRVTAGANLATADLPGHTHTASDIVRCALPHEGQNNGTDVGTRRAVNLVDGARVTLDADDDPTKDRVSVVVNAEPPVAGEIPNALGYVPSDLAGDHFTGSIDCGPHRTIGCPFENMAKYSEDFSVSTWEKNGGSCSVTSNAIIAPDRNQTADAITAVTMTPVIQQQIAGLADGSTYTVYIWARVPTGTRKVSIAIVDNPYAAYLADPTQISLTTSWQRLKITGALAIGQTGLWIVVRQYVGNSDDVDHGRYPPLGRLPPAEQRSPGRLRPCMGVADVAPRLRPPVVSAPDSTASTLEAHGPGSNFADRTLLELIATGELILVGGTGNGYRFVELMGPPIPRVGPARQKCPPPAQLLDTPCCTQIPSTDRTSQ